MPSSQLTYVDEADDVITVSTDGELMEAMHVFGAMNNVVAKFTLVSVEPTVKPKVCGSNVCYQSGPSKHLLHYLQLQLHA